MKSVAGLILSAGKSERMGTPKALLKIFGTTFLEHVLGEAEDSGLARVTIVLGHQPERILGALPHLRNRVVVNQDYELGQLSSLQCGLKGLGPSVDGAMVFLIDYPFVHRALVKRLLAAFEGSNLPLVIPSFQNRRGHPMILARELFDELLQTPLDRGAITVVRKHQERILHVNVDDPGVLIDVDTPEEYAEHVVSQGKL